MLTFILDCPLLSARQWRNDIEPPGWRARHLRFLHLLFSAQRLRSSPA